MRLKNLFSFIVAAFTIITLTTSCENFKEEKTTVNSLITALDSVENAYINTELTSAFTINETVDLELDSIHKLVDDNKVVLEQKDLVFLEVYKATGKTKKIKKTISFIDHNLVICREQLNNLKTDLENKSLKKGDIPKYLKDEKLALKELGASVLSLQESRDQMLADFKRLRPEVNQFIESLHK